MTRQPMRDLPAGARFIEPDGHTEHVVTTPASRHRYGWVEVRNLSMTDVEATRLLATPGAVEPGSDARDCVFLAGQVDAEVEVLA